MASRFSHLRRLRFSFTSFSGWAPANARRMSSRPSQIVARLDRVASRLPRPLRKYTDGLRNAPISHVVSFLILHELTAIVPVLALFALFHYTVYAPVSFMTNYFGQYVEGSIAKFESYFRRKGWFGFSQKDALGHGSRGGQSKGTGEPDKTEEGDEKREPKYEILTEVALAYAITKALLPMRLILSVWATPWFAGFLTRMRILLTRTG